MKSPKISSSLVGLSEHTLRAYLADWEDFSHYCKQHRRVSLPASHDSVRGYLESLSTTHKLSTISRKMSSIGAKHREKGLQDPTKHPAVRATLRGLRIKKSSDALPKRPALIDTIKEVALSLDSPTLVTLRDKALILTGFAGGLRTSEIAGLTVNDIALTEEGLIVKVSDPIGIPYGQNETTCPVSALIAWLEHARIKDGPLFRAINRHGQLQSALTPQSVRLILKRRVEAIGLDPSEFSGHSLRSGLAISAAKAGASSSEIREHLRHKSDEMIMRYVKAANLFRRNPALKVGL